MARTWRIADGEVRALKLRDVAKKANRGTLDLASEDVFVDAHVAVVHDNGAMKIYVNGVRKNQNLGPHVLGIAMNGRARIGCQDVADKVFDGIVDDVRIYSRALAESEIATLAQP